MSKVLRRNQPATIQNLVMDKSVYRFDLDNRFSGEQLNISPIMLLNDKFFGDKSNKNQLRIKQDGALELSVHSNLWFIIK